MGNAVANAVADLAYWAASQLGAEVTIENPAGSYLWALPAYIKLIASGWSFVQFDACRFGAAYVKPTKLLCSGWKPALDRRCKWEPSLDRYSCGHSAKSGTAPHATLEFGGHSTAVAAAYVPGLCSEWAIEIAKLGEDLGPHHLPPNLLEERAARVRRHRLRGPDADTAREVREQENRQCRAGLRNPHLIHDALPLLPAVMARVKQALSKAAAADPRLRQVYTALGPIQSQPSTPPPADALDVARSLVAEALALPATAAAEHHPHSPWRHRLIEAILHQSEDRDQQLAQWLEQGAPAGFAAQVPPGGWFPAIQPAEAWTEDEVLRARASESMGNHPSFSDCFGGDQAPGEALLQEAVVKKFGTFYRSLKEAEDAVGPILPVPLGNLRKRKRDGSVKGRIIWDFKRGHTNKLVATAERVVLPRGIDHAAGLAQLLAAKRRDDLVWILLLDLSDAFHSIALRREERRFCAAKCQHGWVVFEVLGFGGKAFPLVFCRQASWLSRASAAMFSPSSFRLQTYMDDPAMCLRGSLARIQADANTVLLLWLVLGADIAWHKGEFRPAHGQGHSWIGIHFSTEAADTVIMEVPEGFAQQLREDLAPFARSKGHSTIAAARTMVGRAARVAQVVPEAAPFAGALYAALAEATLPNRREAPPGRVPHIRFAAAAKWFVALLDGRVAPLRRRVEPQAHTAPAVSRSSICYDACPWGGGGVLMIDGKPTQYWEAAWPPELVSRFKATIGDPAWQALWEAVAGLWSLILWAPSVPAGSPTPEVTLVMGDALGQLNASAALRGKGPIQAVSREIAWRRAALGWRLLFQHRPSELNGLCDALSRIHAPEALALPAELSSAQKIRPPADHEVWLAWLDREPPAKRTP